jgi:hypothetical protein
MGLDTGLQYRRASYGPFAENLKLVETRLVNNGLLEECHVEPGRLFKMSVGPTFEDARRRYAAEIAANEDTILRLVDLFCRIRTTQQAELVATIDFARRTMRPQNGDRPSEADLLHEVLAWKKKHRPSYDEKVVGSTIRNLAVLNWLDVAPSRDLPTLPEPA